MAVGTTAQRQTGTSDIEVSVEEKGMLCLLTTDGVILDLMLQTCSYLGICFNSKKSIKRRKRKKDMKWQLSTFAEEFLN